MMVEWTEDVCFQFYTIKNVFGVFWNRFVIFIFLNFQVKLWLLNAPLWFAY